MTDFLSPPENIIEQSRFYQELCRIVNMRNYGRLISAYDSNLYRACSAIGTETETTLFVDRQVTVSDDLDLTNYSNIFLAFIMGGQLLPDSGKLLTLYRPENIIACKNQHIFAGAGSVTWAEGGPIQVDWFTTPAVAFASVVPYSTLKFSGGDTYSLTASCQITKSYVTVKLNGAKLTVPTGVDIDPISINPSATGVGGSTPLVHVYVKGPGHIYNTDGPLVSTKGGIKSRDVRYHGIKNIRIEGFKYGVDIAVRDSATIKDCTIRDNVIGIYHPNFFTTLVPQICHMNRNTLARGSNGVRGISIECAFRDFFVNGNSLGGGDFTEGIYATTGTAATASAGLHIEGLSAEAIGIEDTSMVITGISQDNPAVVTCENVPVTVLTGDVVRISAVAGMTEVNGINFTLGVVTTGASGTFELSGIDSTGYTAYDSAGIAREVHNDHCIIKVENVNAKTLLNMSVEKCSLESGYPIAISIQKTRGIKIESNRFSETEAAGGKPFALDADCKNAVIGPNYYASASPEINCDRDEVTFIPEIRRLSVIAIDGASYSTGNQTLDMSTVLGSSWPSEGIPKGYLINMTARDSGSAGVSPVRVRAMAKAADAGNNHERLLRLDGSINDAKAGWGGYVEADENGDIYLDYIATGADTLDIWLTIDAMVM